MRSVRLIRKISDMIRTNGMDPESVRQLQASRFRSMLRHAVDSSPYYRARYRGIDVETCEVSDLPVLTKKAMIANFDDIVTDRAVKYEEVTRWIADHSRLGKLYRGKYAVATSSGSTGTYGVVVHDLEALDHFNAALVARVAYNRERSLPPRDRLKELLRTIFVEHTRVAIIAMSGVPLPSYTLALFRPKLFGVLHESRVFSTMAPLNRLVDELNEFQPDTLFGYPSVIDLLARERLAGRLRVKLDKAFSGVMTGSEPLSPTTKELVRRAWNLGVQDVYGALECIVMARSCGEFDRMHVMSDQCIVEVVDGDNRPVPTGQRGQKILVTNLFNRVQPIIRYELTDVSGISADPCRCSWPFPTLMSVDGRTDDIFYIPGLDGGYEALDPTRFFFILTLPGLAQSQLLQTARAGLTFRFVPAPGTDMSEERVRGLFMENLRKAALAERLTLAVERVDDIPRQSSSGKFRQIMSMVGEPVDLRANERVGAGPAAAGATA